MTNPTRRRIRIIYKQREPTFSEKLEARARRLVEDRRESASSIEASVLDEIALTLDQLDSTRGLHADLRRQLLRLECYIDTEIMQREPKPPFFYDYRIRERDMLRDRLLVLAKEARQLKSLDSQSTVSSTIALGSLLHRFRAIVIR